MKELDIPEDTELWPEHGVLSPEHIELMMKKNEINIFPYASKKLTGCGYNISASEFVFSTGKGVLEQIKGSGDHKYVTIDPYDTVLICTREYISLSNRLVGSIHSRVFMVSEGLGHIATTVDPLWKGPLLIAINNPSKRIKRIDLKNDGTAIATLTFSFLTTPTNCQHDNPPFRLDILDHYLERSHRWRNLVFANGSIRLFDNIIKLAKDSVNLQLLEKSNYQDLYMLEEALAHMMYGNPLEVAAILAPLGRESCKNEYFSLPLRQSLNEIGSLMSRDLLLEESHKEEKESIKRELTAKGREAFSLCQSEFIGSYWVDNLSRITDGIEKHSKSLKHINRIARFPIKKSFFTFFILVIVAIISVYIINVSDKSDITSPLIALIAASITALVAIWR